MTRTPEVRINTTVPPQIIAALSRARHGKYSDFDHIFHCIQLDEEKWVGVAGDGGNGAYEWFVFEAGKLTVSDVGYGWTLTALREVLKQEVR